MKKSFKFLPDIAIADIAFEATAPTINELFETAAQATFEIMAKTSTLKPTSKKKISLKSNSLENLLYDFLAEIVYLKDTDSIVFSKAEVKVDEKNLSLKAVLQSAKINPKTQELIDDVKAITMHMFSIKKEKQGYKAVVVLDI